MIEIARPDGPWTIGHARAKLAERAALPGASGYDLAAAAIHRARSTGLSSATFLACAMPCSWMVNGRADSRVFQRWLAPPFLDVWSELVHCLGEGRDAWRRLSVADRAAVAGAVTALATGGGLAAISKVLALLCPETVPLMDDAALGFALGVVGRPTTADEPTASPECFVPMVDWFVDAVDGARGPLDKVTASSSQTTLDVAQTLDRLVWFESWGYRHSHARETSRWWWVRGECGEGIVPIAPPHPSFAADWCVDLDAELDDPAWRERARAALDAMKS